MASALFAKLTNKGPSTFYLKVHLSKDIKPTELLSMLKHPYNTNYYVQQVDWEHHQLFWLFRYKIYRVWKNKVYKQNSSSRVSSSFNTSRSNILAFGTTGLGSVNQYSTIISPNPANEQFQIDFGSSYNSLLGGKINIYNTLGQTVYSSSIEKEKQIISRSSLDGSGIYFISVSNAQGLEVSRNKLVLQ